MNKVKDILEYQIYPNIYQKIAEIFPEFAFKRINNGYQSASGKKIDFSEGKPGKVYIYDNNPGRIVDYTRGGISIWDYLQQKNALSNQETLKELANLAGVSLDSDFQKTELEEHKKSERNNEIWESACDFFTDCLNNPESKFSEEAEELKIYLYSRNYLPDEIRDMGLGFLPSVNSLKAYLLSKGFSSDEAEYINLHPSIGKTHRLIIPYREKSGKIRGIAARNINYKENDEFPKYLYSTGLKRDDILFNLKYLKNNDEIVIVEGLLDAVYSSVKGLNNLIALGGTSLNHKQAELLVKSGVKRVSLAFDNDHAGKQACLKAINVLRDFPMKIYIAALPENIKDPDQLIREQGIQSLRDIISNAESWFSYLLEEITSPYIGNTLTDKERDSIISLTYQLFLDIEDSIEKELFFSVLAELTKGAISKEAFRQKSIELKNERKKQKQERDLQKLLYDTDLFLKEGKTEKAIEFLNLGNKRLIVDNSRELIENYNYNDFLEDIKNTEPVLKTGISSLDAFAGVPHGAITLIAGRPSHGKTTFMYNLMLNMSGIYPDKKFYFFSYEEQKKFILLKILNRLINRDIELSEYPNINTNLERIKAYLRDNRDDNVYIETGRQKLKKLIDSERIVIIDKAYAVEDLANVINFLNRENEIGAVFIDYIQRIRTNQKSQDKRVEIANISDYILNYIAKDTGLPVILGAQFNRGAGESPKLEHLKEAGNLEEDANLVLSVYQEARENTDVSGLRTVELEIKTLKNRDGAVNNKTILRFDRYTGNISDY